MSNSVRKLFVSSKIMHISVAEEYMELFIYFNYPLARPGTHHPLFYLL